MHMKKMQRGKQGLIRLWKNQSKKVKHLLIAFVIVATIPISGCVTGVPILKPPACPMWSEDAIIDLEKLIALQHIGELDIVDLEYHLGLQQRHCEALDAFLKKD